MNPSIRIHQNYVTSQRSISRETVPEVPEDPLFTRRIPPTIGVRKLSDINLEDIDIEAC